MSAIAQATVSSSIHDLFEPGSEGRNWALFVSSLTSNPGFIVASVFGIRIAQGPKWRWIFYLAPITTSALSLLLFTIHESHPSRLLDTKLTFLQPTNPDLVLYTRPRPPTPGFHASIRPFTLLITEPRIFLTSFSSALSFVLLYLLPVTLPLIYALPPINSTPQTSLLVLFTLPGLLLSTLPRFYHITRRHRNNTTNSQPPTPAKKLLTTTLAAPTLAISL
ncbi:hypothetical protein N7G274_000891 [Stereocaulon virgatum]|uniref:Major facilitator superfamily (MFS) profile domain-containing protein n=1 Tax=Stereocaulon virgatum TaxID=373712 RepID=A0ABR4AMA0_9LECA